MYEGVNNRDNVKRIIQQLDSLGIDAIDIVNSEEDIGLGSRTTEANRIAKTKPCILISIHSNAHAYAYVDPACTIKWVKATDEGKKKYYTSEWTPPHGVDVFHYTEGISETTKKVALLMSQHLKKNLCSEPNPLTTWRGTKAANFYILRKTNCPAVLIEGGFHTNKEEAKLMLTDEWKNPFVQSIVSAILELEGRESIEIKSNVEETNPIQTTPDPVAEIVTSTIKNHPRGYYKNGDSGPEIQEIQHALDAANFWTYNGFTNNFRGVTEKAIINFQRANGLKADGFVGVDTLNALASKKVTTPIVNYEPNEGPTKELAPERLSAHAANVENTFVEGRAPWMKIVLDEAKNYGGHYENSDPLKSRIKNAYFTIANEYVNPTKSPANTSWCAAFASWVLQQTNFSNPSTCRAREFDPAYDWNGAKAGDRDSGMREIQEPVYGCIVVWRSNSGGGHVGFYYGKTAENKIVVIGGNQGNSLKFSQRHPNGDYGQKVVGYFLPENYTDNPKDAFTAADLNLNVVEMNKSALLNKFAETDSSKT